MEDLTLLEKFSKIAVKNDSMISPDDKKFCDGNQKAYESSLKLHKAIKALCSSEATLQDEIMTPLYKDNRYAKEYYMPKESITCDNFIKIHEIFINQIVSYFENTYNVSLNNHEIEKRLLPSQPENGRRINVDELEAYCENIINLTVKYEDIIFQIREQLGGFSFAEKALAELKADCRSTAWGGHNDANCYAILKGDTIQFEHWFVEIRDYGATYRLNDSIKPLFKGLVHFEHGRFEIPDEIARLIWDGSYSQTKELVCLSKVKQLKFYKNRRMDVKFCNTADAMAFATNYLDLKLEAVAERM